ncbi:MAG: glycosyltransferase family 39 protein [Lentisphaerae bacterium]|nr:glycosyltransferase family 39 protein [Lentisphaerota bacterium]
MLKNPVAKLKIFDDPGRAVLFFAVLICGFYTLQCSLLQNILGLDVLETITWGAQGVWGHAKHPPLSGWLGYGISRLSGHCDFAMYLAAQLCLAGGVWFVYRTARLFLTPYRAGTAALLLYFLYYYNPSETKFCTYPLEMLLVPGMVYCFFHAVKTQKWYSWAGCGICAGLGILNKYSCGLFLIALAVVFFSNARYRSALKTAGPYLAAFCALALIAPHLKWLCFHDFSCFKHVSYRLNDTYKWYQLPVTAATALYPFATVAAVLFLAVLPDRKTRAAGTTDPELFREMMILSVIPAAAVVVLALCGHGVIMMWFCSMAAFTGIAAVALFPKEIDGVFFKRICLLLLTGCIAVFTFTSVYLLCASRPRLHSKPENFTIPATEFYQRHCPGGEIPVVVGSRYYACLLENYLPHRPPACETGDPEALQLHRRTIEKRGALLIGKLHEFQPFFEATGIDPQTVKFEKVEYSYASRFGRSRRRAFYLGILKAVE